MGLALERLSGVVLQRDLGRLWSALLEALWGPLWARPTRDGFWKHFGTLSGRRTGTPGDGWLASRGKDREDGPASPLRKGRDRGMRVLITGATGFVGRRLTQYLTGRGHAVSVLSRRPDRALEALPGIERAWRWDARAAAPAEAFHGVDAVVHLAGESVAGRWTARKRMEIQRSRVEGTRALVEGIGKGIAERRGADAKPRVLVSASAIGYYGDRGDEELTEEAAPGDDFLARVCRAWEREADAAGELGMRVVRLRIGIVLGPGGAAKPLLALGRLGLGGPLGSGRQWWSWIHIDDLLRLVEHAIVNEIAGAVNAVAPEAVRQREFARRLGRVLARPAVTPMPAFLLKIVLGEFASELLSSRRVVPRRALASGFEFRYGNLDEALAQVVQG